jgi:hypothetical protein
MFKPYGLIPVRQIDLVVQISCVLHHSLLRLFAHRAKISIAKYSWGENWFPGGDEQICLI